MVICPDCGKEVKDAKFCSNCGALLPTEEVKVEEPVDEVIEVGSVESEPVEDVVETVPAEVEPAGEVIEVKTIDDEPFEPNSKQSKFCANCGEKIDGNPAFCPHCGFKLNQESSQQTKFCQSCGKKININAEICPYCGVRVAGVVRSEEKSVALAAILSFLFPGLGHLYNGLTKKGVSFIIAYIVSAILIFLLIGFVLVIIVWIWALIDAIKTTEAINRGESVEDKLI